MNQYFTNLNETLKKYFKVLSEEIPEFLHEYIDTPEMQRIGKLGVDVEQTIPNYLIINFFILI